MKTTLVICSHGLFAAGLLEAAQMIAGGMDDVEVFSLVPGVSGAEFRTEMSARFARLREKGTERFLCLADLYGGTPCTTCISLMREYPVTVVSGLNLAMLIETYFSLHSVAHDDLPELAVRTLQESARVIRLSDFE